MLEGKPARLFAAPLLVVDCFRIESGLRLVQVRRFLHLYLVSIFLSQAITRMLALRTFWVTEQSG